MDKPVNIGKGWRADPEDAAGVERTSKPMIYMFGEDTAPDNWPRQMVSREEHEAIVERLQRELDLQDDANEILTRDLAEARKSLLASNNDTLDLAAERDRLRAALERIAGLDTHGHVSARSAQIAAEALRGADETKAP